MINELYNVSLPKWPHTIIKGKKITPEQAKDIIFKTDNYFHDSHEPHSNWNNKRVESYRKKSGLYLFDKYSEMITKAIESRNEDDAEYSLDNDINYPKYFEYHERLLRELGIERLNHEVEFIRNDLADSSYIGGANGYVDCEGNIFFNRNIGKWPSVEDVHRELLAICDAFPYLEMYVSVYDIEQCQRDERPANLMVSFIVKDGNVIISDMDFGLDQDTPSDIFNDVENIFNGSGSCGVPKEWFDEFAKRVLNAMKSSGVYDEIKQIIEKYEVK